MEQIPHTFKMVWPISVRWIKKYMWTCSISNDIFANIIVFISREMYLFKLKLFLKGQIKAKYFFIDFYHLQSGDFKILNEISI